jgi:amino acid adenylation domain-containing protein/non-ribosomal peptide synthase protein (TIGR01720 family)
LPGVQLINGYGPTEGTTFSCCYRVPGEVPATAASIPIGRPIANTEVYILDEELEPVPVGVHGELYIGGTGVGRGYLQRAGLTAEKFVPHPFSSEGGRLYRTGDECRYLADGRIEYRGRLDQQVKVRGYRIELGEIETVLGQHAAVAQCVMNVWATQSGDKRLVGYVVWETGQESTVTELRRYLSERLPEYMVPGQWVVLAELPLTANGKVDRSALPSPDDHGLDELIGEYVGPRTATEEIVAGIWAEVLEVEQVGVHDNFFEMGGHSLLATQVMSRAREAFAVELPLRSLFEQPTVKGLAAQLDAALKSEERVALPPLTAVEHDGEIPLSYAQQRLWFLDQLEPNNPFYNIPAGVRLSGELNVEALERTLSEIVRRHEVLRTSFMMVAGEPRQVIGAATEIKLPLEDLSDLHLEEREQEAARLAGEEACEPFDLSRGPLLRARLLRLAADEHVLLVTMHHIVSDGWSRGVLMREVSALYQAYCDGAESPLPELAIQYADFAVWQRQWLSGDVLEEQLNYWREQLRDLNTLELPTDRVRPAVQSYRGASMGFALGREETAALKQLSRREGATLFMVLLAAFQVLLSRYSGQSEVVVGTPIANRNREETEDLIGFFVNTLALRVKQDGNLTFQQLLKHVREVCLGAYAHQDVPFEKLVEELQPERDLSCSPLFQVMFVLQNAPGGTLEMGNLSLSSAGGEGHTSKYDLLLGLSESDEGLTGGFTYSTDLYDESTIVQLIEHFKQLLRGVTTAPELPLTQISMLTPAEREQLLREWNQTATYFPPLCLHELFAEQARQRPEATALIYEDEQMSYGELERRANQLAHHLQRLGVGPEVLVGVCLERTPQMIVALLAVLKAGGAYLPLDPAYPLERLSFMLDDARVKVLLTELSVVEQLPAHGGYTLCLDEEWERIASESEAAPECAAVPENLAYVMYTSGSTGQPKGVMTLHRNVVKLLWGVDYAHLDQEQTILQLAPISFDAATFEIWGALLHGAQLQLYPGRVPSVAELAAILKPGRHWTVHLTAALLNVVVDEQVQALSAVEQLLTGGEVVSVNHIRRLQQELPWVQLINGLGPTETTTFSLCYRLPREVWATAESIPIGRPIANTEVYLLDEEWEPVPVGVRGELYVGGAGLARGYLRRAGLTAEKFLPDPFSGRAGARLYRSGDLGRYLADGNIEYRGRLDQQVKVRGYRIELGEIEAVLGQQAAVAQCVVNVWQTESGNKRLVGYVVWEAGQQTTVTELRRYLSERLPGYMVPGQWVVLEQLPLTASGKVDRKALPVPEQSELSGEYVPPRTATEEIMAGIVAKVLEVEQQVGIHDNFFELGGHSLLATQVISRARETFGVELPLRSLFEGPMVSSLSRSIEQFRLEGMQTILPPLLPRDGVSDGEIPLSYAQQRLWFLDQLEPNNPFYNIPAGVRLSGELNIEALERTLSEVVRRHEVLRTSFITAAGEARQVIDAPTEIKLALEDLSFLPVREREQEAERRAGEEAREPFDLSRGPLLRARLIRLAADEHVLLVTMHHIVSDGWSIGVLVREVSALYQAYCAGAESPLAELATQYADFALWQRQWLSGDVLEKQLGYWREQLRDLSTLELPADRVRPAVQSYRGARIGFALGQEETTALKELSRREGATLFMVLLAAFQVLLSRYSGQSEVVIGTDVANRNHAGTERLIGFFVNQLVLRTELSGARNFVDVVQRAREICLEAYANQDVPFEKLVEELQPERDLSRSPLFQVKLVLQNAPGGALEMGNLSLSSAAGEGHTSKFDLMLALSESDDGLSGAFEYSTDLFDRASIVRLQEHFQQLLRAVAAAPELPLTRISILSAAEREQLLREWNQTTTYFPPLCLHELFAEQARQRPAATALRYKDEQLSYDELERRANQLAHHLQRLGVGPEVVVGICLERTPQLIVALLAVLKAGGAYLPLDPEYPLERLSFMLEDAAVAVLLTELAVVERLPAHWGYTLCVDEEWEQIASASETLPACAAVPENLAYVMYTSGSTGQPKGVMITHRNIVRLLWGIDYAHLDQQQTILQLAPISFDASTFEVWGALLHGAELQLYPGRVASAAELGEMLVPGRHWTLWLTASLFNAVVDEQVQALSAVEQLLVGGEALSVGHIRRAQQELPGVQLINGYGPTEGTTFSCCYRVPGEVPATAASIPIGRPIANTEVYILDEELEPVPVGVHGELYIGGTGVGRGYLQRAGLTAEKFVPHPFSSEGGRLYRTGDECRYLADGRIEYRGRLDQQVKVRGYRIELGEIETVLGQHAAVAQCVMNVWQTESGDKRLVGYVVWETGQEATVTELRRYLSERLPEYMVPGQWVVLAELPLTANGKVDRRALPSPDDHGLDELIGEYVGPRTATEEIVAGIWAEVLEVEQVGVHDNFFEMGGHSLLATQVMSRTREAFAVELPLRSLFESPTVKGLAAQLDAVLKSEERVALPPLKAVEHDGEIPLSYAQQRLWFLDQLEPNNPFYNIPAGVRLSGELHVEALERTLSEIVRRHEVLRTSFTMVVGEPRQVISAATKIKLPLEDFSHLPAEQREEEAARLAGEEAREPFDLSRGPLLRARLLRLAADEHVLLATMHHIVSDGWSMGVLVREVSALYEAYCAGAESPLPELAIQYADFAVWQRQWLSGDVLEEQMSYWRKQLRDLSTLKMPTDRMRPPVQSYRGASVGFVLGREETAVLKELSRREGVTLFMVLLAAFQVLLSRYSGQSEVVVGTPIANRNRVETEDLIGFFVNTLALRVKQDGNLTFQQLLKHVREVCLGAYAHQDVPFEKLVEELQPERDLSCSPLFQVMFVLQNAPGGTLEMGNLSLSSAGGEGHTSKYDLLLGLSESDKGLAGEFSYSTDLYDESTILQLIEHFKQLLRGVTTTPELPLTQISMLTPAEREQLRQWNQTATYFPPVLLHEPFEQQVRQRSEATALIYKDEQMSYGELERRANQLAHHLQRLGVGPEVLVGICLERTPQMVVALLAVLKAGGAYLPLDPAYPPERLSFMLKDAAVRVLLSQRELLTRLAPAVEHCVCLDEEWQQIAIESETRPECAAVPENLAYVIYTSGSTGKPKGVMITHQAICNHMQWMQQDLPLEPTDRLLQKTPFSFDASVFEFYAPLQDGAQLVLLPAGHHQDVGELLESVVRQEITTLHMVPTQLWLLVQAERFAECRSLKRVFSGGEQLLTALAEKVAAGTGAELYNLYGPTEASIEVINHRYDSSVDGKRGSVPIGRPISNTEVYVLDEELEPAPIGVHGEIYIGGVALARGYLQRAALTAEKFIPDPFSGRAGARLYRTGDEGRYLADGNIDYRGRLDQQVKLRGYRIELGEIETVLGQHEAVAQCVVNVQETETADQRLVGYVVWESGQESTVTELRQYLSERLPEYMVPGQWVVLEELPLTSSKKVDRKALPTTEQSEPAGEYVAPRTATEEALARIWAQVLELDRVGIHNNFFELGGDSIISIQVVARAAQADIHITPRQLFSHQTVAGLAAVAGISSVIENEQGLVTGPVLLTPIQRWFFDRGLVDAHHYNQSVIFEADPTVDPSLLEQATQNLIRHHDALRMYVVNSGSSWQQINGAERMAVFSQVDLSQVPKTDQAQAIEARAAEFQASLNLTDGPLIRVVLFNLGAGESARLLIVIHHLVTDGVSWRILLEDLQTIYQQLRDRNHVQLMPKTASFKYWAEKLNEHAHSPAIRSELDYWLSEPRRNIESLPVDFSNGANTVASARHLSTSLTTGETQTLLHEAPKVYGTLINDALLTALAQSLVAWTGRTSMLVDLEGHGREEIGVNIDLTRTVGWFTTMFPVLLDLTGVFTLEDALKRIKEQLRKIPNKGIGYGLLRYLSGDEKVVEELASFPQASISFNYLGQLDQVLMNSALLKPAAESSGPPLSHRQQRGHLLELTGMIADGRLQISWTYSENVHRRETIERIAQKYIGTLQSLIMHCKSDKAGGYTPSDFPKAGLSQTELDKLLARVGKAKGSYK